MLKRFIKVVMVKLTKRGNQSITIGAKVMTFECGDAFLTDYLVIFISKFIARIIILIVVELNLSLLRYGIKMGNDEQIVEKICDYIKEGKFLAIYGNNL